MLQLIPGGCCASIGGRRVAPHEPNEHVRCGGRARRDAPTGRQHWQTRAAGARSLGSRSRIIRLALILGAELFDFP
eukprot:9495521-Pyramimonas_sp.AAC.1